MRYPQNLLLYCIFTHHKSLCFILKVFTIVAVLTIVSERIYSAQDKLNQITAWKFLINSSLKKPLKATVKMAQWRLALVTYETSLRVSELPQAAVGPQIRYISVHVSRDTGSDVLTQDERTSALQELLNFLCVWVGREAARATAAARAVFSFDCGFQSAVCCAWLSSGWSCQRK